MTTKEQALALQHQAAQAIQAYSQSQANIWRQIPYWAVMANGRRGWSDQLSAIIHSGILRLESSVGFSVSGHYTAAVDLASGTIIGLRNLVQFDNIPPVEDRLLCFLSLAELDASLALEDLKQQAQQPFSSYMGSGHPQEWQQQAEEVLAKYGYSSTTPFSRPAGAVTRFYVGLLE